MERPPPDALRLLQQRWISNADWQAINDAIGELYDHGADQESYARCAFRALGRLIPHDLSAFAALDPATQQLNVIVPAQVPADFPRALEGFAQLHRKYELFNFDPGVQGGRPYMRGDWFSRREFRETDIFADAYGLVGMNDHLSAAVGSPGESVFVGLLRRSEGTGDYSERDRTVLATLQPHLRRAWQLTRWRAMLGGKTALVPDQLRAALGITRRQAEILSWVAAGKTNQEIATIAQLSEGTVKLHLANLFQRLGVETRLAAVRVAWAAILHGEGKGGGATSLTSFAARSRPH